MAEQAKAVPLVVGLGLAIFTLLLPAISTYRQHVGFEAGRFGLELNRNNQALIDIMRSDAAANPTLYKYTLVTRYFRATHPQIGTRIEFAGSYRPWVDGAPMVYSRHFKDMEQATRGHPARTNPRSARMSLHRSDVDEAVLASRACFNQHSFRNLEGYLKLIVRFATPEPQETFVMYQQAVERVRKGTSIASILTSPTLDWNAGSMRMIDSGVCS